MVSKIKFRCDKCGGLKNKSKLTSLPVKIGDKTLVIAKVAVKECLECGELHPTVTGVAKINRCLGSYEMLFARNLP